MNLSNPVAAFIQLITYLLLFFTSYVWAGENVENVKQEVFIAERYIQASRVLTGHLVFEESREQQNGSQELTLEAPLCGVLCRYTEQILSIGQISVAVGKPGLFKDTGIKCDAEITTALEIQFSGKNIRKKYGLDWYLHKLGFFYTSTAFLHESKLITLTVDLQPGQPTGKEEINNFSIAGDWSSFAIREVNVKAHAIDGRTSIIGPLDFELVDGVLEFGSEASLKNLNGLEIFVHTEPFNNQLTSSLQNHFKKEGFSLVLSSVSGTDINALLLSADFSNEEKIAIIDDACRLTTTVNSEYMSDELLEKKIPVNIPLKIKIPSWLKESIYFPSLTASDILQKKFRVEENKKSFEFEERPINTAEDMPLQNQLSTFSQYKPQTFQEMAGHAELADHIFRCKSCSEIELTYLHQHFGVAKPPKFTTPQTLISVFFPDRDTTQQISVVNCTRSDNQPTEKRFDGGSMSRMSQANEVVTRKVSTGISSLNATKIVVRGEHRIDLICDNEFHFVGKFKSAEFKPLGNKSSISAIFSHFSMGCPSMPWEFGLTAFKTDNNNDIPIGCFEPVSGNEFLMKSTNDLTINNGSYSKRHFVFHIR